jgi:hypothetical protein
MSRQYNIIYKEYTKNSNNSINVDIENLDTIINHSADNIYCSCLEYIPKEQLVDKISIILNKIKPKANIVFCIQDIKKQASDFINATISGDDLLKKIKNFQSILSIEDIYTNIDTNIFKLVQLWKENDMIYVSIERMRV